jgi:endonuclease/exonuclease/phosphatase family metal-dependent hydrolase
MKTDKGFVRISFLGIFSILSWILILAFAFSVLAAYISPANFQLFAVFGLLFPVFFLLNFICLVCWFAIKHYMIVSHLVMLLLTVHLASAYFAFSREQDVSKNLNAITYNVHGFRGYKATAQLQDLNTEVAKFLSSQQADIVCIQEFVATGQNAADQLAGFVRVSDYKFYHFAQYWAESGQKLEGLLIMSKFPITANGKLSVAGQRSFAAWADLSLEDGQSIRVYNIHLASFRLRRSEIDFIGSGQFIDRQKVREMGRPLIAKFFNSFSKRAAELHMLLSHLELVESPSLLCGDFNDTPSSYTYRQIIKSGYSDSFSKSGNGFGSTFAGNIPLQRIDYLFSYGLSHAGAQVFRLPYSNHYPVAGSFLLERMDR